VSIKTSNFTYDVIENYYLNNLLENEFWLFGSRSNREEVTSTRNASKELLDVLSKTVFGKNLSPLDFSFMIRSIFWEDGRIYDNFDDEEDLENKQFYVLVEPETETGSYEVFKCISNNYGSRSTVKPQINNSINQIDGFYNLSDGYIWKYMTSISSALYRKFSTRGFAPIVRNAQVESIANDGIDYIEILNPDDNFGYQKLEGSINSQSGFGLYLLNINTSFFEAINSYRDSVLYVESQETGVKLYTINSSRKIGQRLEVLIDGDIFTDFNPSETITILILPQIRISGNGTGAIAIPTFNTNRTRINGIRIIDQGQGYTKATAIIVDPPYFTQADASVAVRAEVRPIIGPPGGHGSNIISELNLKTIGLSSSISSLMAEIPDVGSYTSIALVKNPIFEESFSATSFDNRLKIELEGTNPVSGLVLGDTVLQTQGSETVSGIIHEIEGSNIIYLVDYDGPQTIQFDADFQLVVRNSIFNINTIELSDYVAGSGTVIFVTDFLPVERSEDKTEQIKILIDF
jgi:hypothetical protein